MLTNGTLIDDRYRITSLLGEGGCGAVYKGEDAQLGRVVALKVLNSLVVTSKEQQLRFLREGKALARLKHDSIPKCYQLLFWQNRIPVLVMEFVEGMSLSEHFTQQTQFTFKQKLQIADSLSTALGYAHSNEILHRDLSPRNVIIKQDGDDLTVKLIDFGLAAFLQTTDKLTDKGLVLGSPPYISPEQCRGNKTDPRSDIYSLGCLLYELFAGTPPFTCDNGVGYLFLHQSSMPPVFAEEACSDPRMPDVQAVVFKCLMKDPGDRFQSADELRRSIERLKLDDSITFKLPEFVAQTQRKTYQRRWLIAASGLSVVLVIFALLLNRRAATEQPGFSERSLVPGLKLQRQKPDFANMDYNQLTNMSNSSSATPSQATEDYLVSWIAAHEANGDRTSICRALIDLAQVIRLRNHQGSELKQVCGCVINKLANLKDEELTEISISALLSLNTSVDPIYATLSVDTRDEFSKILLRKARNPTYSRQEEVLYLLQYGGGRLATSKKFDLLIDLGHSVLQHLESAHASPLILCKACSEVFISANNAQSERIGRKCCVLFGRRFLHYWSLMKPEERSRAKEEKASTNSPRLLTHGWIDSDVIRMIAAKSRISNRKVHPHAALDGLPYHILQNYYRDATLEDPDTSDESIRTAELYISNWSAVNPNMLNQNQWNRFQANNDLAALISLRSMRISDFSAPCSKAIDALSSIIGSYFATLRVGDFIILMRTVEALDGRLPAKQTSQYAKVLAALEPHFNIFSVYDLYEMQGHAVAFFRQNGQYEDAFKFCYEAFLSARSKPGVEKADLGVLAWSCCTVLTAAESHGVVLSHDVYLRGRECATFALESKDKETPRPPSEDEVLSFLRTHAIKN